MMDFKILADNFRKQLGTDSEWCSYATQPAVDLGTA
jgi:hypothetical protein